MTNILAIVILSGASCVSPVEQSDALRLTIAGKTPCAVVVRAPVGNPFKAAQMPNTITAAAAKPKAVKKAVHKSKRNGKKKRMPNAELHRTPRKRLSEPEHDCHPTC